MATISQTIFSWMIFFKFRYKFHWSVFPRVQLTIFRQKLGANQPKSHHLNQWWLDYWCIYASLNELTHNPLHKVGGILYTTFWNPSREQMMTYTRADVNMLIILSELMSHKSHTAPVPYPTMHHFVTEMCTCVHISVTKWCIVGYLSDALWDLWESSILREMLMSCRWFLITTNTNPIKSDLRLKTLYSDVARESWRPKSAATRLFVLQFVGQEQSHQSSTLLSLCGGNPLVTVGFFAKYKLCGKHFHIMTSTCGAARSSLWLYLVPLGR